ncbi:MAG: serpin family protein [Christensenellales bacterium]
MKKAFLLGVCVAMIFAGACGNMADDGVPGPACIAQGNARAVRQVRAPVYPKNEEEQEDIEGYADFLAALSGFSAKSASALLGKEGQKNAVYSPVSLYMALALSASGASGNTLEEMVSVLGLPVRKDDAANLVKALYMELYGEEEYGHLFLYQSLWLSSEYTFHQSFLKNAQEDYFAEIFTVDPAAELWGDPISEWVAKKTGGKLERQSSPLEEIVMNLVSVIDFYSEWTHQFIKERNTTGEFTLSDGTKVTAEYMNSGATGGFYRGNGWTQASLSCKNGAQMSFILPDEGTDINDLLADEATVAALLSPNDAAGVEGFFGEITWSVPKFDFQSELRLADMLKSLGMQSAFGAEADFSETSTLKPLFLADARQGARIAVNENGVSAAAYTELFYTGAGMPQDRADMILNRPFAFVINYRGVPLFVGVVNNPS